MNKLVLVLFGIVLIAALVVGIFYLFQTQSLFQFSFSTLFTSSAPIETATQKAVRDCKNSGASDIKNAESYLGNLITRTGNANNKTGYLQVVNLGNTCWGIWVGDENGKGKLFWEDNNGKINQVKATVKL